MTRLQKNPPPRPHRGLGLVAKWHLGLAVGCFLGASSLLPQTVQAETAPAEVTGVVFVDENLNGQREGSEPGLAGVAVSNGRDVVLSDGAGRYHLSISSGDVIFISKPRGYLPPLSEDGQPLFYYLHDPQGTPAAAELRYPGVAPSGPLPDSVDFALQPHLETDDFQAIVMSDPQAISDTELDYFREAFLTEMIETPGQFALIAGDLLHDDFALLPRFIRLMGSLGRPWYTAVGNHELNRRAKDNRYARETYKQFFGPPYYSFNVGGAHFVVLDDVYYFGRDTYRDEDDRSLQVQENPMGLGAYEGRIDETQLAWLRRDLARVEPEQLVIVTLHLPLGMATDPEFFLTNKADLIRVLSPYSNVLILSGHLHRSAHYYHPRHGGEEGGPPLHEHQLSAVSGGWWGGPLDPEGLPLAWQSDGTPGGYYILKVRNNRATLTFKAARQPASHQLRSVILPVHRFKSTGAEMNRLVVPAVPVARLASMELVVNFFESGPKSQVTFRVGGGDKRQMYLTPRKDPAQRAHERRQRDLRDIWPKAKDSDKIWVAPLPQDLAPGLHRLSIEASDDYGQVHRDEILLEVSP